VSVSIMNEKKTQQQAESLKSKGFANLVGEIKSEFNKISWTSREELRTYTKIVVGATFAFGLGVFFMDIFIQSCLDSLNVALRLITG
jgi:preprotein translocase subunit SecE